MITLASDLVSSPKVALDSKGNAIAIWKSAYEEFETVHWATLEYILQLSLLAQSRNVVDWAK